MFKAKYILGLFVLSFLLVGCAGARGGNWIGVNVFEDAGEKPENYEATIKEFLYRNLKDPDSLKQFSVGEPQLASCSIGIYGPFWGWRVQTEYNAKNSYGGYVGLQAVYFWFHGERLTAKTLNPTYCPDIQ
jgi:hypothetical protein